MRILVAGAGIAGLSAAIPLARAGHDVELVDPHPGGIGAAISLTGAQAMRCLEELGLADACLEHGRGMVEQRMRWFDAAGDEVFAVGGEGTHDKPRGVGIFRPVLLAIMRDAALAAGAELHGDAAVAEVRVDGGRPLVRRSDGDEREYDIVIGADGINSAVRASIFETAARSPEPSGQGSLRWMAPGPPIPGPGSFYNSADCLLAGYPLPGDVSYVVTTFPETEPVWRDGDAARKLLARQLEGFTAPYPTELRARLRDDAEVIYRPFEWILVPDPWVRGPVVLIGDAAHATSPHLGYGGVLALEDGVLLGRMLAATSGPEGVGDTLAQFMRKRFERCRLVVETSVEVSRMEQDGRTPDEIARVRVPALMALEWPFDDHPEPGSTG